MKTPLKFLVGATAGLLLLAAPAIANQATAFTQLGFTIELSSGTLNVAPSGTFNDARAAWNNPAEPFHGSATDSTLIGSAFANAGASTGISNAFNDGNYFVIDSFAMTEAVPQGSGNAAATSLALYNLSFSGVTGADVTLTLTPLFYFSNLTDAGGSFGYVSAFLSLGLEVYYSTQDSSSNAGLADFGPITLTVGAGDTVALTLVTTAGVGVPDTASTAGLLTFGLLALIGVRRQFRRTPIAA